MVIIEDELNLTDLIDVETLQKIQDSFSAMSGIAAITTDKDGIAVTEGTQFSDFCNLARSSKVGRRRCEKCDRMGAEMAENAGASCAYYCYAGLMDFAAPIMAHGQMVGCLVGGQVLTEEPNDEKERAVAEELELDPDEFVAAVHKIHILNRETIDNAANALYTIANILSEIAYNNHEIYLKNLELDKASSMKSDFLANMSHEIRTPMNVVIGMAEMALREDISPAAREYIGAIKSSGQTLLTIINDILDFSKIESGKMDIIEAEYEPMSIVNDLANLLMTRIGNKEIELTIDVNPDLPNGLYGDSIRIKQIMVNIANNAVKFTENGNVHMKIDFWQSEEDKIELEVAVTDTGRGIKKQDIPKLFQSFQQVDSKRNRNIEGTGLGLAISKQLVKLMHGKIHVDSVYGEGSAFTFVIPQRVTDRTPSIERMQQKVSAAGLLLNEYAAEELQTDLQRLGVDYLRLESEEELPRVKEDGRKWLFVEQEVFTDAVRYFLRINPDITGVVLTDFHDESSCDLPNVHMIKKPLYSLNLSSVLKGEEDENFMQMEAEDFDFTAPEAEILVVDDNAINLTVVQGLLHPLNMKIDTALSGKEAVTLIMEKRYDIIFMDHMMPEMDGVETTRVIRRMLGENGQVPIVALTANAVDGTKEMFISEGMNDFVTKPIELRMIAAVIKKWLPKEKILRKAEAADGDAEAAARKKEKQQNIKIPEIDGLDVKAALRLLGSEKLFWSVLKEYYRVIDRKYNLIRDYEQNEQWKEYTIEVHALKSASRQIGATELAAVAERMEAAGGAKDAAAIHETTPGMLAQYICYKDILSPYFPEEQEKEKETGAESGAQAGEEELKELFAQMREAMDALDMDAMAEVISRMERYTYSGAQQEYFDRLKSAVDDIDTEKCEKILDEWSRQKFEP